jgi:hypothetical protein
MRMRAIVEVTIHFILFPLKEIYTIYSQLSAYTAQIAILALMQKRTWFGIIFNYRQEYAQ